MRFKVDENLPVDAAELRWQSAHDVVTVLEQQLGGSVDARWVSVTVVVLAPEAGMLNVADNSRGFSAQRVCSAEPANVLIGPSPGG